MVAMTKMQSAWLSTVVVMSAMCVGVIQGCSVPLFMASKSMFAGISVFPEGIKISVSCFTGCALQKPGEGVSYNTICTNNVWIPRYTCIPVTCTGLPVVENAQVLYTSSNPVTSDKYSYAAEVRVYCDMGWTTENGRDSYNSVCTITSQWSDVSPCSAPVMKDVMHFTKYRTSAPILVFPYRETYGMKDTQQYKDLAGSFNRALLAPMKDYFSLLYVGAEEFSFTKLTDDSTQASFNVIFQSSEQGKAGEINAKIDAALATRNYIIYDPNSNATYQLKKGQLNVVKYENLVISKEATVGLSVGGALVGLMAVVLIVTCIVCRDKPCCAKKKRGNPDFRVRGFSSDLDHNAYGLPRTNFY